MKSKNVSQIIICLNRKASFNYYFKDLYELNTSTMVWSHCVTKGDGPSPRAMHTANLVKITNIALMFENFA